MVRTIKVAVVGSGLAGLTAAYLLTQPVNDENVELEVHIFEKAAELGMDSSSVSLQVPNTDNDYRIDVPMRAFRGGYYPQLIALYNKLGVKFREADFSYSFSLFSPASSTHERSITTTVIPNYAVSMPSTLIDTHLRTKNSGFPSFIIYIWTWSIFLLSMLQLMLFYLITVVYAWPLLRTPELKYITFAEWTKNVTPTNFLAKWIGLDIVWQNYVQELVVPIFSAVCTAPEDDIWNHPIEEFLDYIWRGFGTHHYVVLNGVRDVVARLSRDINHVHVSAPITSITTTPEAPHLASITCLSHSGEQTIFDGFHHVILATQASAAVSLLKAYAASLTADNDIFKESLERQAECVGKFHYRKAIVINHTDDTLLPDDSRDHRDLNLINFNTNIPAFSGEKFENDSANCVPPSFTMATHRLPRPEGYPTEIFQTTNPFIAPKEDKILSVASLERAVLSVAAKQALQGLCQEDSRRWWECSAAAKTKLGPLQGAGKLTNGRNPGVWICGSYASPGIPLLEGCVVSARNVILQGVMKSEGVELKEEPWVG